MSVRVRVAALHAHFPKCRHRPDPAAWSGEPLRGTGDFPGIAMNARLTVPQGDHYPSGPLTAWFASASTPISVSPLIDGPYSNLEEIHWHHSTSSSSGKVSMNPGQLQTSQVKGSAATRSLISSDIASYRFSTLAMGGRRAGGQAAAGRCPATAADTLGRRGDVAARGCDERIGHHFGLAANLGQLHQGVIDGVIADTPDRHRAVARPPQIACLTANSPTSRASLRSTSEAQPAKERWR